MTLDNLSGETVITVHNQAGQQIFRQQLDLSGRVAVRLPVAQQPSGIYYWEVRSGTDSLSGKLIKRVTGTADMRKIDMHTHILPEKLPNFAEKFGLQGFYSPCTRAGGVCQYDEGGRFLPGNSQKLLGSRGENCGSTSYSARRCKLSAPFP
jgi:hypothetical protein